MGKKKNQSKTSRIFTTIGDIGSLFVALLYIVYVAALLLLNIGTLWLNYCMLGLTVIYVVFFILKIFLLNEIITRKKSFRIMRFTLRYSKWGMKLINATFVAFSIANIGLSQHSVVSLVGIVIVGFSFMISILWDISWWVISRKLRDLKTEWDQLSLKEKNQKIEFIIGSFVQSIDNVTGLELSQSAGKLIEGVKEKSN